MQTDVIIVGQGIAGTFLSFKFQQKGIQHIIIDQRINETPSNIAAGIINPVTGRRIVKTWKIDEVLPFADQSYDEIDSFLNIQSKKSIEIADLFTSQQMKDAFQDHYQQDAQYLSYPTEQDYWKPFLQYDFGWGKIRPALLIHTPLLIQAYQQWSRDKGILREELFDTKYLSIKNQLVTYKDIQAKKIIFCGGTHDEQLPFFKGLPFAPNKGEALILEIPDLPTSHVIKRGMTIVPWDDGKFWMGSVYQWKFDHIHPTELFKQQCEVWLKEYLKLPYQILDHQAAVRPATLERRPFVGFHPNFPQVGIMNGMGTKGCSLAPYFAEEMAQLILNDRPIDPEANINRFTFILNQTHGAAKHFFG